MTFEKNRYNRFYRARDKALKKPLLLPTVIANSCVDLEVYVIDLEHLIPMIHYFNAKKNN
jgi:hypothetical protein